MFFLTWYDSLCDCLNIVFLFLHLNLFFCCCQETKTTFLFSLYVLVNRLSDIKLMKIMVTKIQSGAVIGQ